MLKCWAEIFTITVFMVSGAISKTKFGNVEELVKRRFLFQYLSPQITHQTHA